MPPRPIFISSVRMHHIINIPKYRLLKDHALDCKITGLVKVGKPAYVVFNGTEDSIKTFLERLRGMNYRSLKHFDTKALLDGQQPLITDGSLGLQEVESLKVILARLDLIGERQWFRTLLKLKTKNRGPVKQQDDQKARKDK